MNARSEVELFDADELLALARMALERNDVEGALVKLKKVIGTGNPPLEAIGLGARVYAQIGLYARAEKLYESYLEKNPAAVLEQFQLGMTRFDAGKPNEALKVWDGLLKEQPAHPPALFYRSLALAQTGNTGEARKSLNQLLNSVPVDNLYFGRGKELLQAIESGAGAPQATVKGGNGSAKPAGRAIPDPYRTEH